MNRLEVKRLLKAIDNDLSVFIRTDGNLYKAQGFRSLLDRGLDKYEIFCKMPSRHDGVTKFETDCLKTDRVFIEGQFLSDLLMEDINQMIRRKSHD